MADGLSNDGIAQSLYISVKTVETIGRSVFVKLGLKDETPGENRRVKAVIRYLTEAPVPASAVPSPATSFVGRSEELDRLNRDLERSRLLTIVGVGGLGKTRVGIELLRKWADTGKSVRFIDLTAVDDDEGLAAEIAAVFGAKDSTPESIARAVSRTVGRAPLLVLFDNAEAVLGPLRIWVERINREPQAFVMVTSRAPMDAPGEVVRTLPPMSNSDSLALLRERCGTLTAENAEQICHEVGGLPLSIELVAGYLSLVPANEFVADPDRLRRLFAVDLAEPSLRLRAALDSAFDLLDPGARHALQRLSLFPGGFTLDVANDLLAELDADAILVRLVGAALLSYDEGRKRYRIVELVRHRALDELRLTARYDEALAGFASWTVRFVRTLAPIGTERRNGLYRLEAAQLSAERHNVDAGIQAALGANRTEIALEVVERLGWHWAMTSAVSKRELIASVFAAIRESDDGSLVSEAHLSAGVVYARAHDLRALDHLTIARNSFSSAGNERGALECEFWLLTFSAGLVGSFDECIARAKTIGDWVLVGYLLEGKAQRQYLDGGPIPPQLALLSEAETIAAAFDPQLLARVLISVANRLLDLDRLGLAATTYDVVGSYMNRANRLAVSAGSTFDLCELLLLDLRIEVRFGTRTAGKQAALAALDGMIAREGAIAATAAILYSGELLGYEALRSEQPGDHGRADDIVSLMRVAAGRRNNRPGNVSRVVADNFPEFATVLDASLTDNDVFAAATKMRDLVAEALVDR